MNELVAFYYQQGRNAIATSPLQERLQKKGLQAFTELGFPEKKHEEWKYTSLHDFSQLHFEKAKKPPSSASHLLEPLPFDNNEINIQNGNVLNIEGIAKHLPAGVIVQPLAEAVSAFPELLTPYLDRILSQEHGFHALNSALLGCGVFIYLPEGSYIETPIVLRHWQDEWDQAVYSRHLIIAEENSAATIIEMHQGAPACRYFTNAITEIKLAASAKITHYTIQCESKAAYHVSDVVVQQSTCSQFVNHSLSLGGKWVRCDTHINLQEPEANCILNGIYAPSEGQLVDHHTIIHHKAPRCQSTQDYKGILLGQSQGVFNGRVVVNQEAQKTQAKQQNKNILLSSKAEISTKPQLEILADDVVCAHGATVGQLDADALFYLATRGIEMKDARHYLIQAFASENIKLIENKLCSQWVNQLLNQHLADTEVVYE